MREYEGFERKRQLRGPRQRDEGEAKDGGSDGYLTMRTEAAMW